MKQFVYAEGEEVCYANVRYLNKKECFFEQLYVSPKLRKQGIAKKLIGQLIDWADNEKLLIRLYIMPSGQMDHRQLITMCKTFTFRCIGDNFDVNQPFQEMIR